MIRTEIFPCKRANCRFQRSDYGLRMSVYEIAEAVVELPENDRLELARRIVAGVFIQPATSEEVAQAVRGIKDVLTGRVRGLTEAEFREALR